MDPEDAGKLIGTKEKPSTKRWIWQLAAAVVFLSGIVTWQFYLNKPKPTLKPSIAILPFENISDDSEQEYFTDGMTDDIITDLSKIKGLLVISRNSTFTYKGQNKKVSEIAKELNVRYVLEGSVRRAGDQVRINAQLIDAETDHHVWAERFDDTSQNIFEMQDRITKKIISELALKLSPDEANRIAFKGTDSIIAYDIYLKGQAHLRRFTPDDLVKAISYFKQAIQVDPNYGQAYVGLAQAYRQGTLGGRAFYKKTGQSLTSSRYLMSHYLELAMKNQTPGAYSILAYLEARRRHYNESIMLAEKAVALAPNDTDALRALGTVLMYSDRLEEGLQYIRESMNLNPFEGHNTLGLIYFSLGQYEKALETIEHSLAINPNNLHVHIVAAVSFAHLGREVEAQEAFNKYLTIYIEGFYPEIQMIYFNYCFKNPDTFNRFIEGLVKAGYQKDSKGYSKVDEANKLNGQDIKELLFGKTVIIKYGENEFLYHRSEEGAFEISIPKWNRSFKGKSWIEGDKVCNKMNKLFEGVKYCSEIYFNPEGNVIDKNQYLELNDAFLQPISIVD